MNKYLSQTRKWIKSHQKEFLAIVLVLLIASFLRLYKIDQYMTFLGDEGRDARVVMKLITEFDPVLIGPMTSVTTSAGHMFLGPAYYYMMAPAMLLSGLSPVGPAVMVAILSVVTTGLIWWFARTWFSPFVGLTAAFLYAISDTVITFSHSSWNPNIMPFFALLAVWGIYQVYQHKRYTWLPIVGICVAFMLQSHYLALILLPLLGGYWLASLIRSYRQSSSPKSFIKQSVLALGLFLFLMSPLVIFDARHNWMNFHAIQAFFTQRQTTVNLKFYRGFEKVPEITLQVYNDLLTADWNLMTVVILLLSVVSVVIFYFKKQATHSKTPVYLLYLWLITGLIGLSIYKQHIYSHYFGFIFPVPHLITAWVLWQLWQTDGLWKVCSSCLPIRRTFVIITIFSLTYINILSTPIIYQPPMQYSRTQEIADQIIQAADGKPFNIALIAKSNYDETYRFILERKQANLVAIDPQQPETITDQLFVICENPDKPDSPEDEKCAPIGHPKTEIAAFGWAKIEQIWEYPWGHKLYKLTHASLPEQLEPDESL